MTNATATFTVSGWDEQPWDERDGAPKMTRAVVQKRFEGDLDGESELQYLMAYRPDGSADYVGLERIRGTLGDRRGTFILSHVGRFVDGAASGRWTVVEGSGTDDLADLEGASEFSLPKGAERFPFELEYRLPVPAARR